MARQVPILVAAFILGAYALCAQTLLLRESQVLLFGSELSWGLVLAFWLAGIAIGAQAAGRFLERFDRPWLTFAVAALLLPAILVAEVAFLRLARFWLHVGPGEYIAPTAMLWVTALATLPVSILVGITFPAASALVALPQASAADKARAVGRVFLWEAAGSLLGGILVSFVLVDAVAAGASGDTRHPSTFMFVSRTAAMHWAMTGAVFIAIAIAVAGYFRRRGPLPVIVPIVLAVVPAVLAASGMARSLDTDTQLARWTSFSSQQKPLQIVDTRYQNLAVGRLGDQYSLYTNGLVAATWPNPREAATQANLAACQCPAPRRILILGGGAEGLLKELLRYKPARIDYVTLDPAAVALLFWGLPQEDQQAIATLGDHLHYDDIRRFVRRAAAAKDVRYDLVILAAPEPASTLEARLYTREFFGQLASIMTDDGVLALSLHGSVGYWSPEPAAYVGSVVLPLRQTFADVMMTFEDPVQIFAARRCGVLTDSAKVLAARYHAAGVQSPVFDPLWFESAAIDILDATNRSSADQALRTYPPEFLNTDEQPVAGLYHMRFWLKMSEARHNQGGPPAQQFDLLGAMLGLRFQWIALAAVATTVLAGCLGALRGRRGLARAALFWSVGTTGFATIALEIVLLYTFQTLYGYVYGMIGLVVGVFMFGLVVGSLAMNRRLSRPAATPGLRTVVALDLATMVFAAGLVLILGLLRGSVADWTIQVATFTLVALAGVLGGLVFPLAAAVVLEGRPSTVRAAGAVDAADNAGACLGALLAGVLLVPILGVSGACLAVAGLKALSALLVGTAIALRPQAPTSPSA